MEDIQGYESHLAEKKIGNKDDRHNYFSEGKNFGVSPKGSIVLNPILRNQEDLQNADVFELQK